MFALVRNLSAKTLHVFPVEELVEIVSDSQYVPFAPAENGEYHIKKETDYGRFEGGFLYLHNIVHVSENENVLNEMAADPRKYKLVVAKRKSLTPVIYPEGRFQLAHDKTTTLKQREKTTADSKQNKRKAEQIIMKEYTSKNKKKSSASTEMMMQYNSTQNISNPLQSNDVTHPRSIEEFQGSPLNTVVNNDVSKHVDYLSLEKKLRASEELVEVLQKTNIELNVEVLQLRASELKVTTLEGENTDLKEKLRFAMEQVQFLTATKDSIETAFKKEIEDLKASMQSEFGKLPGLISSTQPQSAGSGCNLAELDAIMSDNEVLEVPKGKIHIGGHIFVSKRDIGEVDREHWKFTARLKELCIKIWGDDLKNWSLTGPTSECPNMKKVTTAMTNSIATILRGMKWDPEDLPKTPKKRKQRKEDKGGKKSGEEDTCEKKNGKPQNGKQTHKDPSRITCKVVRLNMRRFMHNVRNETATKKGKAVKPSNEKRREKVKKNKEEAGPSGDTLNSSQSDAELEGSLPKSSSTPLKKNCPNESVDYDFVDSRDHDELLDSVDE